MRANLILTGLVFMVCSSIAHAEYDANALKKLFTDETQRKQIDAARTGNKGAEVKRSSKVKVDGYMTRSDGKGVVWINDKSTLESTRVGDIKVQQSTIGKEKKVTISTDGKSQRLKPGETWHKETGQVVDIQE